MLSWAVIVDNTELCAIVCQVHCGTRLIFKLRIIRITLSGWLLCPFSLMDRVYGQDWLFCCQVVLLRELLIFQSLIQDLLETDVGEVVSSETKSVYKWVLPGSIRVNLN